MVLFLFGHVLDVSFTLGMMVIMGVGFGFTYAMPYAIVPDAIEYDYCTPANGARAPSTASGPGP